MTYSFKRNAMVLTKVKDFTKFKHFSTWYNAHIILIY